MTTDAEEIISALVDLHGAVSWVVSFIVHQSGTGKQPALDQALEKLEAVAVSIGRLQAAHGLTRTDTDGVLAR